MKVEHHQIGEVLTLHRRPADIDATTEYIFLGVSAHGRGCFKKPAQPGSTIRGGSAFEVAEGDFLYNRLFAWNGSFEIAGPLEDGCIVSGEFPTFAVDLARLDPRWLRYWLLSEPGLREVDERSAGSTPGSRNRLREYRFLEIEIPLPQIDEQRRVATSLDRAQSATERLTSLNDRARVLSLAAGSSLTQPGPLNDAARARGGWRRVRLHEVLRLTIHEVKVETDRYFDVAGVYSFGRGLFERGPLDGSATSYRTMHELRSGQLVMSRLKAWEGALALVPPTFNGWFLSPEFPTFDLDIGQLDPHFFEAMLTSETFWGRLRGASKGIGARKERVSAERLLDQIVEIPSLEEQRRLGRHLGQLSDLETVAAKKAPLVAALAPSLLNQAFAGLL